MPPKFQNIPKPKAAINKVATQLSKQFREALTLHQRGQLVEAKALYLNILKIQGNYYDAIHLLGVVSRQIGEPEKAVELISKAITINPKIAFAYNNRGNAFRDLRQLDLALADYNQAIELKPDYAEAYYNRGDVYKILKKLDDAILSYNNAILYKPNYADAYCNRGNAYYDLKQIELAIDSHQNAITLGFEFLYGVWLQSKMLLCDWGAINQEITELIRKIEGDEKQTTAFSVLAMSDSLPIQKKAAEIWVNAKTKPSELPEINKKNVSQHKIRIAYFSMDFSNHPVAMLTAELFELHDRSKFEVIAFSFGPKKDDEMRKRLELAFDQFIDVENQSDLEIAQLSRDMEIDIAIDLAGHTKDSRTGIFAHRVAPLQINYIGYPGTMGAQYMDYIVADKTLIPQESEQYYTEKIIYLPCFQVNDRRREIAAKQFTRTELGLPEQGFVFCCFSNTYKFTPQTFDSWMRILHTVEGSVLFLYADHEQTHQNLRKEAQARGINPDRLVFGKRLAQPLYLARYRVADLFLDTLPFNAGTTASDALWAGLPVLTCKGESFAGRMAASLLTAIGLPELITHTPEEYEALAIELANHPSKLLKMKQTLLGNRTSSTLFDTPVFTKNLETAYIKILERYHEDMAPENIAVGV